MNATYLRLEILRVLREPQTLIFTVAMPIALFLVFSSLFGNQPDNGITASAAIMQNMAAYGALAAAMFSAAAIALERRIGWNRQLRLTPLSPRAYVLTKGLMAWLVTLPALILVYVAGAAEGVRLAIWQWAEVLGVTWAALLPFVLLGIALGYLGTSESISAITTVLMLGLAMMGGLWFPVQMMPAAMAHIAKALPSYWLGMAGRAVMGAPGFGWAGVAVLAGWTAVIGLFAANRYRADTRRA
jgi:ABC-2 type transport system permease protein